MANNNQNKSWRMRLDEMEEPRLDPAREEVLLKKLELRMREKTRRRPALALLVAAGIILVLTGTLFLLSKLRSDPVKSPQTDLVKSAPPVQNIIHNTGSGKAPLVETIRVPAKTGIKKTTVEIAEPVIVKHQIVPDTNAVSTALISGKNETPDSVAIATISTENEKKKLKVIHVNNLPEQGPLILEMMPYKKYIRRQGSSVGQKSKRAADNTEHIRLDF